MGRVGKLLMKPTESLQARDVKSFKILSNATRREGNLVDISMTLFPNELNPKWKGTAIRNEASNEAGYHEGRGGGFGNWICLNYEKRDDRGNRSYSGIFMS